jgi:Protein of unknown function (DUF3602)
LSVGRGGAGNIEAAKAHHRKQEQEKAKQEALIAQKARAEAAAAVEALQTPKPSKAM